MLCCVIIVVWFSMAATGEEQCEVSTNDGAGSIEGTKEVHPVDESPNFPVTLEEFGYHFQDGKLVSIKDGGSFVFEVKAGDKDYNQKHYEALGEVITNYVYDLLEKETKLNKHYIPTDATSNEPSSFFFATDDASSNTDKLMVIIHGSGVVRAGQWSRRLIVNDCLDSGTQLPYIKRAINEGYAVVVLNGNNNIGKDADGRTVGIRGSESPEKHGVYVWENFIQKAPARRIDIVAHSYGGIVTVHLMKTFLNDFQKRVQKIAFTDSVHNLDVQEVSITGRRYINLHAVNWVSSSDPLDTEQSQFGSPSNKAVKRLSAGTKKHEETSWFAFESIFKYFEE